jgi:hypothetical protein
MIDGQRKCCGGGAGSLALARLNDEAQARPTTQIRTGGIIIQISGEAQGSLPHTPTLELALSRKTKSVRAPEPLKAEAAVAAAPGSCRCFRQYRPSADVVAGRHLLHYGKLYSGAVESS